MAFAARELLTSPFFICLPLVYINWITRCLLNISFLHCHHHQLSRISYRPILHSFRPSTHLHIHEMSPTQLKTCSCHTHCRFVDTMIDCCCDHGDIDASWTITSRIDGTAITGEEISLSGSLQISPPGDLFLLQQSEGIFRTKPVSAVVKWFCCGCMCSPPRFAS